MKDSNKIRGIFCKGCNQVIFLYDIHHVVSCKCVNVEENNHQLVDIQLPKDIDMERLFLYENKRYIWKKLSDFSYEVMFLMEDNLDDIKKFLLERASMYINETLIMGPKLKKFLISDIEFIGSKIFSSKKEMIDLVDIVIEETLQKNQMLLPN